MRVAYVMGRLNLSRRAPETKPGSWLICEAVDASLLDDPMNARPRSKPMNQSLIVYDRLGAVEGDTIAVSESREASNPFYPDKVPLDAYCSAILDTVEVG